jgi:hypothetical protein
MGSSSCGGHKQRLFGAADQQQVQRQNGDLGADKN